MWIWLGAQITLKTASAVAVGQSTARRSLAYVLLAMTIVLPFVVSLAPLNVVVLCFFSILALIKVTQIASSGARWSIGRRLWHLFGVVDTRLARRVPPVIDARALGVVLLNFILLLAAAFALTRLSGVSGIARYLAGTVCVAAVALAAFEVFSGLVNAVYRAVGIDVPAVQRNPIASRSLAEFWGQRWNRVVGGWLREFVFEPLARRRHPRLGLAAAFAASGAMHSWLIIGLGIGAALQMGAYFVVQGAALFLEARLGVRRAPPAMGRLWTIVVLVAPLPLLFGPWLQAIEHEFMPLLRVR